MNPDFQRRIQRYGWDKAAPVYEEAWQDPLQHTQERLLELADLQPGERVLDIACGTGLVTFPAAERVGHDGAVTAVDLSDSMVAAVEEKSRQNGFGRIEARQMDAESLSFDDASFDVVLCSLGLMYVPDPTAAVREMYRVLAPGGRTVTAVWGHRDRCGWAEIFPIIDRRVKSEVCPLFFQLGTGGALEYAFETAGFEHIEMERFSKPLHFDSPETACEAAFLGGPVALAWHKLDDTNRETARQEYLASIEPHRNGDGYAIPGEFVVLAGRKPDVGRE
ncbi:MAG: class I SAM-dependent methyltransferase [Bacteroidota bacterium]